MIDEGKLKANRKQIKEIVMINVLKPCMGQDNISWTTKDRVPTGVKDN